MTNIAFRMGKREDAEAIAVLFDMANAGLIASIFEEKLREGETWLDHVVPMVRDPQSEIFFGSTVVAEIDGLLAGALICVRQPDKAPPLDLDAMPATDRPFAYLRSKVPGGFLLRDMAVFPQFRQNGIAAHLLDLAIASAYSMGFETVFALVHESNEKLLSHYARRGLNVIDAHKVLEHPAYDPESRWLLLTCHKPDGIVGFDYSEPAQA